MKTTVDIADALLEEAKRRAVQEQTTLKALIEEGLRAVFEQRAHQPDFQLPDCSFGGNGIQPEASELSWENIREMIYEGRGG